MEYSDCPRRDDFSLLAGVGQVVGAIVVPFFVIGIFGNAWTLYMLFRTQIAHIVEVRLFFCAIFASDLLIQLVMGIDLLTSHIEMLISNQYASLSLLGELICRSHR